MQAIIYSISSSDGENITEFQDNVIFSNKNIRKLVSSEYVNTLKERKSDVIFRTDKNQYTNRDKFKNTIYYKKSEYEIVEELLDKNNNLTDKEKIETIKVLRQVRLFKHHLNNVANGNPFLIQYKVNGDFLAKLSTSPENFEDEFTLEDIEEDLQYINPNDLEELSPSGSSRFNLDKDFVLGRYYLHNPSEDRNKLLYLPYKYFNEIISDDSETNCLKKLVKKLYGSETSTNNTITFNSINKFFGENTTIKRLIEFCENHKIGIELYDYTKKPLYVSKYDRNKKYKILRAITFNNHIYHFSHDKKRKVDFTEYSREEYKQLLAQGITFYVPINFGTYVKDLIVNNGIAEFTKHITRNFLYKSEYCLKTIAINYQDPDYNKYTNKITIDLKKAYPNVLLELRDSDVNIPEFCSPDVIEKFDNIQEIKPEYYYFIKKESIPKLHKNILSKCIKTTVLHGFELLFLLENDILNLDDIEYYKPCSYRIKSSKFINYIDKFVKKQSKIIEQVTKDLNLSDEIIDEESLKELKDKFSVLYNGLLGKSFYDKLSLTLKLENQEDLDLLFCNKSITTYDEESNIAEIVKRDKKYRYFNNINFYNFIISRCNLKIMESMKKITENGYKIIKAVTDSITFTTQSSPDDNNEKLVEYEYMSKNRKYISFATQELIDYATHFCQNEDPLFKIDSSPISVLPKNNHTNYFDAKFCEENTIKEIEEDLGEKVTHIYGPPGVGKTHYLAKNHNDSDHILTTTNMCLENLRNSFCQTQNQNNDHRFKTIYSSMLTDDDNRIEKSLSKFNNKKIIIDEYSMLTRFVYSYIFVAAKSCSKIILSGDLNQITSIENEDKKFYTGKAINLNNKFFSILYRIAYSEGNKRMFVPLDDKSIHLTKDYRNDKSIVDLRDYINNRLELIIEKKSEEYDDQFKASRYGTACFFAMFNRILKANNLEELPKYNEKSYTHQELAQYNIHLCNNHKTVNQINAIMLKQNNKEFLVKKLQKGYSVKVSEGIIIICRQKFTYEDQQFHVNKRYKLTSVIENKSYAELEDFDGYSYVIRYEDLALFKPGYACTIHSAQGLTIKEKGCVHNISQMCYFSIDNIYTAVTRFCTISDILPVEKFDPIDNIETYYKNEYIVKKDKIENFDEFI